jgi:hypothetical protein
MLREYALLMSNKLFRWFAFPGGATQGDQRRAIRVQREFVTTLREHGPDSFDSEHGVVHRGFSENISKNGVRVRAFQSLPVHADVELNMHDPEDSEPIRATGSVIWASPQENDGVWVFGIELTHLNPASEARLKRLVEQALMQPSGQPA